MPLTARAAEQHAALWRRLAGARRSRPAAAGPDYS
jgi:hypothetical protein